MTRSSPLWRVRFTVMVSVHHELYSPVHNDLSPLWGMQSTMKIPFYLTMKAACKKPLICQEAWAKVPLALLSSQTEYLYASGIGFSLQAGTRLSKPFLLGLVLDYITTDAVSDTTGYIYATLLVLCSVLSIISDTRASYLGELLGMQVRVALSTAIYRKVCFWVKVVEFGYSIL